MDMLVNLYTLPEEMPAEGVRVCRTLPPDGMKVLAWVEEHFGKGWAGECAAALSQQPACCFIAQRQGQIVGFACYDATAKGYFGPIGVRESERGSGIGRQLLVRCLKGMREAGYGYAVIGWCNEAAGFYGRAVGAVPIPGSEPEHTLYQRMILFSKEKEKEKSDD